MADLNASFVQDAIESAMDLDSVDVLDLEDRLLSINRTGLAAFEITDLAPFVGQDATMLWPAETVR